MMLPDRKLLQATLGISESAATLWLPQLMLACVLADIRTPQRIACFLAQVGHESGRLKYTRELWGPTPQQLKYESGRLGAALGNTQPGDGARYRGRGLIQVTGRANYRSTTDRLREYLPYVDVPDFELAPAMLETPDWAALSAGAYWRWRKLNRFADEFDFSGLTKAINGGLNGLADRQSLYLAAISYLSQTREYKENA